VANPTHIISYEPL
jgi:uncharacterized protein Smg (DUF494 family)